MSDPQQHTSMDEGILSGNEGASSDDTAAHSSTLRARVDDMPESRSSRRGDGDQPEDGGRALAGLRIGLGFDVHALAEGRKLILGGVDIAHDKGLDGHSDADVLAHAVSDALLGAIRGGDIGKLFPDTDPAFEGADSLKLLSSVADLVRSEGYDILDIDSVIAAQEPKLSPYRDEMRDNLARAMGIPVEAIGVKATTTEHLGFEGREEGISVRAVCLVCRCSIR